MSTNSNRPLLWTPQAFRELQHWQQNINALIDQRVRVLLGNTPSFREKDVRFGVTTVKDEEDYPESPANTFWVKLGTPVFGDSPGSHSLSVNPYNPPVIRLAHSLGGFIPVDKPVALILSHGKYFIPPNIPELEEIEVVTDVALTETDLEFTVTKIWVSKTEEVTESINVPLDDCEEE